MFDVDVIIPCYGKSELIRPGLYALASSWKREFVHVTLVNDCSPNTDCNYQDLVDEFRGKLDVRVITTPENGGQGLARQYGVDNTSREWFLFQDEDDQYLPLTLSQMVGCVETFGMHISPDGCVECDENGKPIIDQGLPKVAMVSAPVFEFDDQHTHVITSQNRVWVNAKLYNRQFWKKHDVRFLPESSRHSEDYQMMNRWFYALDFDKEWCGLNMNDDQLMYLWNPNTLSQSRKDPFYGHMLHSWTMRSGILSLQYYKAHRELAGDMFDAYYRSAVLNMATYNYHGCMSFIDRILNHEWICTEEEWGIFIQAAKDLWYEYRQCDAAQPFTQFEKEDQSEAVRHRSDCQQTYRNILFTFEDFVHGLVPYFQWTYEQAKNAYEEKVA